MVLLGTLALTAVAAVLTSGITIGDAHPGTPILWPDSEYNQAIAAINRSYPGSDQLFVIVDGESPDTIKRPEVLHRLPITSSPPSSSSPTTTRMARSSACE